MQYNDGVRGEGGRGCYPSPGGAGCCANAAGFRACRRPPPGPATQAVPATTYPGGAGGKTGAETGREERKAAGRSGETCITYDPCGEGSTAWCFSCCYPARGGEASSPWGCCTGGCDSRIGCATSGNASGSNATDGSACRPRRGDSERGCAWGGETSSTWYGSSTSGNTSGGHTSGGPAGNTHSPRCSRARSSSTWIRGATCGDVESNTSESGTPDRATPRGSPSSGRNTCHAYRTGRAWGFGTENRGPGGCDPGNGTSSRHKAPCSYAANGQTPCRRSPGGETTNSHPTRGDTPWVEAAGIARRKAARGKTPGSETARRKAAGSETAYGKTTNNTAW